MSISETKDLRILFDSLKPWHHLIYVDGIPTKTESAWGEPLEHPIPLWNKVKPLLPDLHGKRILDIGCNDGFFYLSVESLALVVWE
jgi:2-polyprenyl-3-methyl-5-hydroxy-6-metoxy-1,4-benzoquinol methylase